MPVTKTIAVSIGIFVTLFLTIDTFIYAQYSFHFNGIIMQMVFNKDATEVFQFKGSVWLIFALAILAIIAIQIVLIRLAPSIATKIPKQLKIYGLIILLTCYLASQLIHGWFNALEYAPVMRYSTMMPFYEGLDDTGTLLKYNLISINDILEHKSARIPNVKSLNYPLHPIQSQLKKPLNILFIVIDTWRADMLNKLYAPNIYKFSKKSSLFLNHYSGGDCTQPGIFSLFYSVPPSYWTAAYETHKPPVLMDLIKKYHYNTGIFASAPLTSPQFSSTVFTNIKNLKIRTPGDSPWQRDININKRMLTFLQKQQHATRPFFGFLFYDAVHGFSVPPTFTKKYQPATAFNYATINNNTNPTNYFNLYKDASLFDDQLVKQILNKVSDLGMLKNTVIIITADHGEEFNDEHHDHWGHASDFSDAQLKTPMIIYWPHKKPAIYKYMTSHYDVIPSLLTGIFNIKNPTQDYSIGHNIFKPKSHQPFLLVGSYQREGIVSKDAIISYLKTGGYLTTDRHLNPMDNYTLPSDILQKAFEYRTRYSKH